MGKCSSQNNQALIFIIRLINFKMGICMPLQNLSNLINQLNKDKCDKKEVCVGKTFAHILSKNMEEEASYELF